MNPRNLKSNTDEQKELSSKFGNLPVKVFYEKKDGEFDTLSSKVTPRSAGKVKKSNLLLNFY